MIATPPRAEDLAVGAEVARVTLEVTRADLVRYAGASGDFNPIHYSDRAATDAGLPGVIAHGMYTMAVAGQAVADWCGDPGRVLEYGVRFTRPVPVDDERGALLEVVLTVGALDPEAGTARIDLAVTAGDGPVLGRARAVVRLD